MITISVCMIVKNEEDVLDRCLQAVRQFADEIIIADTGSSDRTKEIAGRYTRQVHDIPWTEDFAAARNAAFDKATMDYCMWLDADDVVDRENIEKLNRLKETLSPEVDMVKMRYHTGFDAQGTVTFSYYRERLVRRAAKFRWVGAVHEVIPPSGRVIHSEIAILHKKIHPSDGDRNLRIYQHQIQQGVILSPRDQFYYARELFYHNQLQEAVEILETFLDSGMGWVENNIEGCKLLAQCYQKQEKQHKALEALFRSFCFDRPRAELCCQIGDLLFTQGQIQSAVYWYQVALKQTRNDSSGAFVQPDCYDYHPYIQLCLCYDRLGDHQKANAYNEKAGRIKPGSKAYLYNKSYFEKRADHR